MLIIMLAVNSVSAQDTTKVKKIKVGNYNLTEFAISSGKGATTSGLDTRFDFLNKKKMVISLNANNDRATLNIGKKFKNMQILWSVGSFKNVPWTGAMLLFNVGPFDAIAWNGFGFSKDKEVIDPGYHPNFFMSYEGIGLTFGKNHVGGAIMYFTTYPMNWFASYKRDFTISEKSKIFAEVTYNHDLDIPMFVVGYSIKLQ